VSHPSFRSTLIPIASGLAAVIAVSWAAGPVALAAGSAGAGNSVQAREWWLGGLHVTQAWQTTQGAGVTVAVLGTGVAAGHPDLAGSVTTGPDFTGSGRTPGGSFWGINGTEVAGVIAGHGHGTGREQGILGIAPAAKILSLRVSLEYNDPLSSDAAIARRLPGAIAQGITYAVDHGARIIDLPLDPGTAGLTGKGDPAAAGGSPAEQTAVAYALSKNVVLVAPAGDDGQGPGLVDYPAAYPGVIAVGAVGRNGQVAAFSSRRSYVSLTAPGVNLMTATPPDGYATINSTSTSSGIVAGVAALILSRFPHLTAAQVTRALTGGATAGRVSAQGAGHGTVDAARAVALAASFAPASRPARPAARPSKPARLSTTAAHRPGVSDLAGSLVRYVVAGLCLLIALLVVLLLVVRSRRERADAAAAAAAEPSPARARPRGMHEQRKPGPEPGPAAAGRGGLSGLSRSQLAPLGSAGPPGPAGPPGAPGPSATGSWPVPGGWQGGGLGEMTPSSGSSATAFGPVMTPAPKPSKTGAKAAAGSAGPPWDPAPQPQRTIGPLPAVANSALPPDPWPGVRVPGDMAALSAVPPDSIRPAPFDITTSPDPDFPPRPAVSDDTDPDITGPHLPTRRSLGFAAAPVPVDYAPPQAPDFTVPSRAAGFVLSAGPGQPASGTASRPAPGPGPAPAPAPGPGGPGGADPSYIWDLAATDVFPVAAGPGTPEEPGAVPEDDDPGASS
jgi:Subtilase family